MTSERQIQANKVNGVKGGVKTSAGKAKSSKNARKHGALSEQVLSNEREGFETLVAQLSSEYAPTGTVQAFFVERLALRIIQADRINHASKEIWESAKTPGVVIESDFSNFGFEERVEDAYDAQLNFESLRTLAEIIHRYETGVENQVIKLEKALAR